MKRSILLLLFGITLGIAAPTLLHTNESKAQLVYTLTPTAANDTLTDTDTALIYINTSSGSNSSAIADNISRSITARVIKIDGTVSGTITFQGTVDGTNWQTIDTVVTLTTAADQAYTITMRDAGGSLLFHKYRVMFLTDGTEHVIPKVYYLRRSN